jgi:hypothetical protein
MSAGTTARMGPARAIRWLLGIQIALAGLLAAGDLLGLLPGFLSGPGKAPSIRQPVQPGDQTRRYSPRLRPEDAPAGPGFPGEAEVPSRLTWEARDYGGLSGLLLSGGIVPGDGARFIAHLDNMGEVPAIISLHSPGGSVTDALEIGRHLRSLGITTRVEPGAACFSACPYVLAGGAERRVSRQAMVGVHQHYFGESTVLPAFLAVEDIQRGQADVMAYLDQMGVEPLIMEKAMRTPPNEVYILVESEMTEFGLATDVTD